MAITVKKLIAELEKIENKFLEVEVYNSKKVDGYLELEHVKKVDRKVLLTVKIPPKY